jgi:hypothetical protein
MTPEILKALEPEQVSGRRYVAYPRRNWGLSVRLLLWGLRLYVLLAVPLVIYAFAKAAMQ